MSNRMVQVAFAALLSVLLIACATTGPRPRPVHTESASEKSYLAQGKRYFEEGYYRRAMHELLPLACDGNPEAQYAVGYMYYYGEGVAQDTDVGYFWIKRSADKGYPPAVKALAIISKQKDHSFKKRDKLFQ